MREVRTSLWIVICAYGQLLLMLCLSLPLFLWRRSREGKSLPHLISGFDALFTGCIYEPWASPHFSKIICSAPSGKIDILDKKSGTVTQDILNTGSYNYLGFADRCPKVQARVLNIIEELGVSSIGPAVDASYAVHKRLEQEMVRFLGRNVDRDDTLLFGMGYDTNSSGLSSLIGEGDVILSDQLNHRSIVTGCRRSGARVLSFHHNSMSDLESKLRASILRHPKPKRIFIVVEGIYSMEGHMTPLPEVVALAEKYKAYVYMDEAHSIGATGPTGRGVCEHYAVDPNRVHILMGTFSKSFGAAGGYIVARKAVISQLRVRCSSRYDDKSMSPGVAAQILGCLSQLTKEEGIPTRIKALRSNTELFRSSLLAAGFEVMGQSGSPVVPVLVYTAFRAFSMCKLCLQQGVAIVMVGYPATSLSTIRIRFCMSADHSKEDIKRMTAVVIAAGKTCGIIV